MKIPHSSYSFTTLLIRSLLFLFLITIPSHLYGQDADSDGIVDALDVQPDVPSGMVLNLDETADLNANKDALKKEGSYNTGAYENLVLPYTKKEVTASYSSGNQSLYGDLEVLTDGTYKSVSYTHLPLPTKA